VPETVLPPVGAPIVMALDGPDQLLVELPATPRARKYKVCPLVRPLTIHGLLLPVAGKLLLPNVLVNDEVVLHWTV